MERMKMITAYLDGSLTKEEQKTFEFQMQNDRELSDEVRLYNEVDQAIGEDNMVDYRKFVQEKLKNMRSSVIKKTVGKQVVRKLPVAATILVLLGISIFQLVFKTGSNNLFDSYYTPYQADISTRSAEQMNSGTQVAYLLYQEGDYATSSEILKNYLTDNFDDMTAHFYFGLNALELGLSDIAIEELELVEDDETTPFSQHARWYLALTYIEMEMFDAARIYIQELAGTNNVYAQRAKKLKRAIKQ